MADATVPERSSPEAPWPVAVMSGKLKDYIDRLGTVWVEGEVTQWGLSGGNAYGKLKDLEQDVTLSFRVWSTTLQKLKEEFTQGDRVVALVKSEWWPKGGTLTLSAVGTFDSLNPYILKGVPADELARRRLGIGADQVEDLFEDAELASRQFKQ